MAGKMSLQIEPTVQNSDCHSQPDNGPKKYPKATRAGFYRLSWISNIKRWWV